MTDTLAQLKSYRSLAPSSTIARKRLQRTRLDWLQWLLFDSLNHDTPQWGLNLLFQFCRNYSAFANHTRTRLDRTTNEPITIIRGLLWHNERPGLLGYVDHTLLTNAVDDAGIDLQHAWAKEQCGPLTDNYLMSHCEPQELTDLLPRPLTRWW